MTKYYEYGNATRRLRSGSYTFMFDVVEQVAGNWRGVLKLEEEGAQTALASFGARLGIIEITEVEYEAALKKKLNSRTPLPDTVQRVMLPLKETAAGVVVLRSPLGPITLEGVKNEVDKKLETSEAVTVGVAPFIDPLATRVKTRARKQ